MSYLMGSVPVASSVPAGARSRGWAAVAASSFGLILGPSVILIMCFGVFLPMFHQSFGWPVERISFGASVMSIMVMLISPLQGALVDRYGPRRMVLTFIPLWGASLLLMAMLPDSLAVFYLACLLLPLAGLGLWPLSYMKIPTTWFDRHLGIALGLVNVGPGIGAALMPALLGAMFATWGWRTAYTVLGATILLVWWPLLARFIREGGLAAQPGSGGDRRGIGVAVAAAVRGRPFWIMVVTFFVFGTVSTGLLVHQVAILVEAGLPTGRAITIQSTVGLASIVGRIGTGWLLDRVRVQFVAVATALLAATACALLASELAVMFAIPAAAVLGHVLGAEFDVLSMLIRRYHGVAVFGRIYGLVFAGFALGGATGAGAIGFAFARSGSYALPLATLSILLVGATTLFALLGPYRYGPEVRAGTVG